LRNIADPSFQRILHEKYGKIMKIIGLPGTRNIVLLFDPDEIEKVSVYMYRIWLKNRGYKRGVS
jgi:hypothetical protein